MCVGLCASARTQKAEARRTYLGEADGEQLGRMRLSSVYGSDISVRNARWRR